MKDFPDATEQRIDKLYVMFLVISLVGGILGWLRLTNTFLGIINLGLATFTFISFIFLYLFGRKLILHEYNIDRQVVIGILGAIPGIIIGKLTLALAIRIYNFSGSWIDVLISSLMALNIVILEETFRGAIYMVLVNILKDIVAEDLAKLVAFMAAISTWVLLHLAQRSFDPLYLTWLFIVGTIFQLIIFSAGLGSAILCHYTVNILMSL